MVELGRGRSKAETWLPDAAWRRRNDWPWLDRIAEWSERLAAWVKGHVATEAERSQLLSWIAVAFGSGIAAYFASDREPIV